MAGTGPTKSAAGVKVYVPSGFNTRVPTGVPLVGSVSTTGVPGACTVLLPVTVKPVMVAVVPAGRRALSSTLPEVGVLAAVMSELGASVSRGRPLAAAQPHDQRW